MFAWFVKGFNWLKLCWSAVISACFRLERRAIGPFASPVEVWQYLERHYTYTGDKLLGMNVDFYMDPFKFQTAMELGKAKDLPIDCDDVASWAYHALLTVPNCKPRVMVLHDAPPYDGCHCICVFELDGKYGAIDTNGLSTLPDLSEATICAHWKALYAASHYEYHTATVVTCPW
jgi:hypothetical protein